MCKSDVFSFFIHWTADQRHMDSKQMSLEWLPHETHVSGEQRREEVQRTAQARFANEVMHY